MNTNPSSVLIIDDDPIVTNLLQEVMRRAGGEQCRIVCSATASAARAELGRDQFQLVLLDFKLPDASGLSLLEEINRQPATERPGVIMLTGGGSEEVAVQAMKMGAMDYIVKSSMNVGTLRRNFLGALERNRLEHALARSNEELRQRREQLEADLALARGVQQAMLPQHFPVFPPGTPPARSVLRFAHRWIPSEKLAGDWFDVFPVTDTVAGVFLGDVMGHGVRAALVTALLRGLLREQLPLAASPGRFLAAINCGLQNLLSRTGDLIFVTAAYLTIDTVTGKLQLANAGHPPLLHLRRSLRGAEWLTTPGGPDPALGLLPDTTYNVLDRQLDAGDGVLLFTDGVCETVDADGQEFGRDRLRASIQSRHTGPGSDLIEGILADVRSHQAADVPGFEDDICLFMVDYHPAG